MNSINRLETAWSPKWDLGVQDEFGFFSDEAPEAEALELSSDRPRGWAGAGEAFQASGASGRRLDQGASRLGDLIAFFESLAEKGGR